MTDSSADSADTVISVCDSRLLSQSQSNSESNSEVTHEFESFDGENPDKSGAMGNRQGGDKKKKDDAPQEKNVEPKPRKKGKKSKGKSKRNSQNVESVTTTGEGACASPSSSTVTGRSKCKRPDVLADLGQHSPGSPLGSPESASGSQGTLSLDEESDVVTLGYSTPLLSTPQVQRYVFPKQNTPQQSSTERLEELGRSIERTIIDKLSDKPQTDVATAAVTCTSAPTSDRKEKRNVKKKRALGQAVIDSDSFTLPLQEVKTGQTSSPSPTTKRLNIGTEKISLRASQESPVSPWLRDDDTSEDEEQLDEMFISCIDLSYNLADICSEKEFTEYGSLDSKKHAKSAKDRAKDTSLSPRIARKPIVPLPPPSSVILPELKNVDSRETPPKSDSSTSTLAEVGHDTTGDALDLDVCGPTSSQSAACQVSDKRTVGLLSEDTSVTVQCSAESVKGTDKPQNVKKKNGKSKSTSKSKKKNSKSLDANKQSDIPKDSKTSTPTEIDWLEPAVFPQTDVSVCDNARHNIEIVEDKSDYENEPALHTFDRKESSTPIDADKDLGSLILENSAFGVGGSVDSCGEKSVLEGTKENKEKTQISDIDHESKSLETETILSWDTDQTNVVESTDTIQQSLKNKTPEKPESLSPKEPASPKNVPPPSPLAMDSLAEIDEDDEEAIEAMEGSSQSIEIQLFGETVLKRLSSLVESQSQDEDIEERFKDFQEDEDKPETDSPPVNLGSMALLDAADENDTCKEDDDISKEAYFPSEVIEDVVVPGSVLIVEKSVVNIDSPTLQLSTKEDLKEGGQNGDKEEDVDEGTLKRKKKKSSQKKSKKDKMKKDPKGNVVKRPEIPAELKQVETTEGTHFYQSKQKRDCEESEKENTPPKRESQQIEEVIDAYGSSAVSYEKTTDEEGLKHEDERPRYESDDWDDDDSDSSFNSKSRSSGHPSSSSMELTSRCVPDIPDIEETFSELLSVKHILEDFEDRTPTEEVLPTFVDYNELRSPPELVNGRRSRMSPAVTDRTESDLDISEQRDDISTDSMYADDEDDGASEVLFSRSYSEPAGNEVVVSCTFYNTQHNNNNIDDSDDFWEDYSTADESFKQIEISADAASSTFQNARKQMHDIHQHLQDLRRQMEHLQEEVESASLTPEYSMDSEDKRPITE